MADENNRSTDDPSKPSTADKLDESLECQQKQALPHSLDATKMCSPNVLSTPMLRPPFSVASKTNEVNYIPTPSQLNGSVTLIRPASVFMLNPSKLNPFSKVCPNDDSKDNLKTDLTPKFLPLLQNGAASENKCDLVPDNKPMPSTSQSNFVFGENIRDRVSSDKPKINTKVFGENLQYRFVPDKTKNDVTNANGTSESEMLFSSAMKETSDVSSKPNCSKSLSESAREYEESRATKRKYEEVEIRTGEEGETNVLQISCKLFAFDKSVGGTWQERGHGILRLNDKQSEDRSYTQSRLVFRTAGSLRVVLNTKVWSEMTVQIASKKSVRFTAFDSKGEIKVFLLTGSPDDIKQLHRHLENRVKKEIEYQKPKEGGNVSTEPDRKKLSTIGE